MHYKLNEFCEIIGLALLLLCTCGLLASSVSMPLSYPQRRQWSPLCRPNN